MPKSPTTNGSPRRKHESWVEAFIEETSNLESPEIFRRWGAIATLASVLEHKVWLTTSAPIFPNLYIILTGHPGTGKTRTIRAASALLHEIPEFHFAPVSFTFPSLVDGLSKAKRVIIRLPDAPMEYNCITINADELGTFLHKTNEEMSKGLSALYDATPYGHTRRGKDIDIKIKSPCVNLICGVTPSDLMGVMPESAWGQGLSSRIIFIFSDERIIGDDFAKVTRDIPATLLHDLKIINSIVGEFEATAEYRDAINIWRQAGETLPDIPAPVHPKLIHYNSRRKVNLYKLSMIAALDRSNSLLLTREDFNRAMGWMVEAEQNMPEIFKAGAVGVDGKAMDEIYHFCVVSDKEDGIPERRLVNYARRLVPAHSVMRVIEIMERAGMVKAIGVEKRTGERRWRPVKQVEGDF